MTMHVHAPPDGERRKRCALDRLAAGRAVVVRRAQRALLEALLCGGRATIDDARDAVVLPPDVSPECLGAVPRDLARLGIIEREGYVPTCRPDAHARPVSVWALRDRGAAERWLGEHPDLPDPPHDESAQRQRDLPLGD